MPDEITATEETVQPRAEINHGFYATYSNHGCRCDACREAHTTWQRNYRNSATGRLRTSAANRKSRRIQQLCSQYVKDTFPEVYAMLQAQAAEETK